MRSPTRPQDLETGFCGSPLGASRNGRDTRRKGGRNMDTDRIEGKKKEVEGETQQKWGEGKDKARDAWEDVKDKGEDVVDEAEDRLDERDEERG